MNYKTTQYRADLSVFVLGLFLDLVTSLAAVFCINISLILTPE